MKETKQKQLIMNGINRLLRDCLIENAKNHRILTYTQLYEESGCSLSTDFSDKYVFYDLIQRLTEILKYEFYNDRPCLTIIIKREHEKMPMKEFFKLTKILGAQAKGIQNKIFYNNELNQVFACWEHKIFHRTFKNA